MSLTIEAIYENGVLKPSHPIALPLETANQSFSNREHGPV